MLIGKNTHDSFMDTMARVLKHEKFLFYYFSPIDIDYELGLIRGFFYDGEKWSPKIVEYPDVIIDRLKMRGSNDAQLIYEELEDISFTNMWPVHSNKRSELYQNLKA